MAKTIFVNLPVANVAASTAFYAALGFEKNEQFSGGHASAMVWSDAIFVMLLAHDFYQSLTSKPIADARATSGALYALAFDSKAEVDAITEAAAAAGGTEPHGPEDMGFMYSRAFEDLDGHGWGPFWMGPAAAEQGPPEHESATA